MRDGAGEIRCVVFEGDVDPSVFENAKSLKK
ncbi:hypothetical protein ACFL5H_02960 [Candidatus Latescibacterota bacterium]